MFKNIIAITFLFLASITNALAKIDPREIMPTDNNLVTDSTSSSPVMALLTSVKGIIFTLVGVIAVSMFLYTGFQVLMSFGKPDEFKKASKTFLYTIIGLVIIALSYALVAMISGINF